MHAPYQVRIVENRIEDHLAPVALHLGISLEGVGQVGRLGRDAPVQLHEVLQLALQFAVLLAFGRVNLLDAGAEVGDILLEGFQQQIERLAVSLFELFGLLAQNVVGKVAELHAQQLFGLLPLGLGLPDFAIQRFHLRFGLGARFDQRADLGFGTLARRPQLLLRSGLPQLQLGGIPLGDRSGRLRIGRSRFGPQPECAQHNTAADRRNGNENQ